MRLWTESGEYRKNDLCANGYREHSPVDLEVSTSGQVDSMYGEQWKGNLKGKDIKVK